MAQSKTDRTQAKPPKQVRTRLVHATRTDGNDHVLAVVLASVAGAANAGGFFAVGQYTSHMTGYLAQLADNLVLANVWLVFVSTLAIGAFICGAAFSSVLITWAREHKSHHQYALPIATQGGFLICFSWGWIFTTEVGRLFSIACLSFIMGMQNATITKLSGARIRTTHATGMITDIGIEFGRLFYKILRPQSPLRPDLRKLSILVSQVLGFLCGGVVGAFGYASVGFYFSLPLAAILLAISLPSLVFERADNAAS